MEINDTLKWGPHPPPRLVSPKELLWKMDELIRGFTVCLRNGMSSIIIRTTQCDEDCIKVLVALANGEGIRIPVTKKFACGVHFPESTHC